MTITTPGILVNIKVGSVLRGVVPTTSIRLFNSFRSFARTSPRHFFRFFITTRLFIARNDFFHTQHDGAVLLYDKRPRPTCTSVRYVSIYAGRRTVIHSVLHVRRNTRQSRRVIPNTIHPRTTPLSKHRTRILTLVTHNCVGGRVTSDLRVKLAAIVSRHHGVVRGLNVHSITNLTVCTLATNCISTNRL